MTDKQIKSTRAYNAITGDQKLFLKVVKKVDSMTKLESIKAEILTLKIKEIASETDEKYQEIERELSSKNYTFYFRMECLFSNFGGEVHFVKVERLDILEIGAEEGDVDLSKEDLWAVEEMIMIRYNAEL